jgi:GNAT superfamily N-acetyltransferase
MWVQMLEAADAPKLLPLLNAYKAEIGEEAPGGEQMERLGEAMAQGRIKFFVAEENGAFIGMCSVSPMFSTWNFESAAVFEDFYVAPIWRKKGVSRALVNEAFSWCDKAGVSSLWVGAADCDRAMYESLGFQVRLGTLLCRNA